MDIAIMVEGQHGLNWARWKRLAPAVEALGFVGLYRSDHFTNPSPPDLDSLELWVSLTWLATHTRRLQFGPLVTPASFRHPVMTARMAIAVDDLSGGRLSLGVGAGWQVREHELFGFDLLDLQRRFVRFQESLEVISRLLQSNEPMTWSGSYFKLHEAVLLPRPHRQGGPPILVGGNGVAKTLALAARYALEWNAVLVPPARFRELTMRLDALLQRHRRSPRDCRRSLMTGCLFGRSDQEVVQKLRGRSLEEVRARGIIVGTASAAIDQLAQFADAGVQCVMLQWLDLDDLDGLEAMAKAVLPHFQRH